MILPSKQASKVDATHTRRGGALGSHHDYQKMIAELV